jgi:hypothetical protein
LVHQSINTAHINIEVDYRVLVYDDPSVLSIIITNK